MTTQKERNGWLLVRSEENQHTIFNSVFMLPLSKDAINKDSVLTVKKNQNFTIILIIMSQEFF